MRQRECRQMSRSISNVLRYNDPGHAIWIVENIYRQTDIQTFTALDRQTDRQIFRQTYRQADRQTDKLSDRQTNRQTGRQTDSKIFCIFPISDRYCIYPTSDRV